jgi:prepilin-type N-terminal cleavage/methylation domain-containing protein
MKTITNKKAFSLVEIMVTVLILTVGILGTLLYFTTGLKSTEAARDITVATTHGEYLLEEMCVRPTLLNITGTNWNTWRTQAGLNTLPSETITVAYANPAADPLRVDVTVNWTRKSRASQVILTTEMTK